jgi:hypothetical protein
MIILQTDCVMRRWSQNTFDNSHRSATIRLPTWHEAVLTNNRFNADDAVESQYTYAREAADKHSIDKHYQR